MSQAETQRWSRRDFLMRSTAAIAAGSTLAACELSTLGTSSLLSAAAPPATADKALIAITLDLEMSRNFPTWETTHWDYEKGNLDDSAKQYSVAAAKRIAEAGGVIHFFLVGRALEQANVDWLRGLVEAGHPIGNHTYDHVNVTATRLEDVQFRFQRAPWLIAGQTPAEVIEQNIRMCTRAMQERLNIDAPAGFRTPGGFAQGLREHSSVRSLLLEQGFRWVSSLYPAHPNSQPHEKPRAKVIEGIVAAQANAQPFVYPDGLIEVPMSPISDIGAFRNGRWKLEWYQAAIRECIEWAIEHRAVFDFLAHPSCLGVVDPEFKTLDMICDLVQAAGARAELTNLNQLALRAQRTP